MGPPPDLSVGCVRNGTAFGQIYEEGGLLDPARSRPIARTGTGNADRRGLILLVVYVVHVV
jgi:hypothetical protein